MKNRTILAFLFVTFILLASFFAFKSNSFHLKDSDCYATRVTAQLFDFNSFQLEVDSSLDIKAFKVVNQNSGNTIFERSKSSTGIKNNYGYRIFELYNKEKKIFEIGHFLSNNWFTVNYFLQLKEIEGQIEPFLEISGTNATNSEFYYKKFEYNKESVLEKVTYQSKSKKVYKVEMLIK